MCDLVLFCSIISYLVNYTIVRVVEMTRAANWVKYRYKLELVRIRFCEHVYLLRIIMEFDIITDSNGCPVVNERNEMLVQDINRDCHYYVLLQKDQTEPLQQDLREETT